MVALELRICPKLVHRSRLKIHLSAVGARQRCLYGYPDSDGGQQLELCGMRYANFVRYALEKERDVAAVIAEPIRAVPYRKDAPRVRRSRGAPTRFRAASAGPTACSPASKSASRPTSWCSAHD